MDRIEIGIPGGIMPPFDKVLQQAQRGEAKGYDAVWWPCHLMGWHPQSIGSPISRRWPTIRRARMFILSR